MADVMFALFQKRSALNGRKLNIQREAERQIAEIDAELDAINKAIAAVEEAVKGHMCRHCRGRGTYRKVDAAGQTEDHTCPDCKGTGIALVGDGPC